MHRYLITGIMYVREKRDIMTTAIFFLIVFVVPFCAMTTIFATSGAKRLEGGTWLQHGHKNRFARQNFAPNG